MRYILANRSVRVSELKKNPSALIEQSEAEPIAILQHNKPIAYLVPADTYKELLEKIEDYELGLIVKERRGQKNLATELTIDDL